VGTGELYPLSTSPPTVEQVFQLVQLRWRAGQRGYRTLLTNSLSTSPLLTNIPSFAVPRSGKRVGTGRNSSPLPPGPPVPASLGLGVPASPACPPNPSEAGTGGELESWTKVDSGQAFTPVGGVPAKLGKTVGTGRNSSLTPFHRRWIRGKAKLLHTLCVKAGNVGTGLGLYRTGVPALHLMPAKLILAFHQRWTAYPEGVCKTPSYVPLTHLSTSPSFPAKLD
jgi:hypothetical protein